MGEESARRGRDGTALRDGWRGRRGIRPWAAGGARRILRRMQDFLFALNTVAPVFLIIFLGVVLKQRRVIDDGFTHQASQLVYYIALPLLVLVKLVTSPMDFSEVLFPIGLLLAFTLVVYAASWLAASATLTSVPSRGAFVQGAYRSNIAIIGLPVALNMLGERAMAVTILFMAAAVPVYNVLAVIVLSLTAPRERALHPARLVFDIARNPLTLASVAGIVLAVWGWEPPAILLTTAGYLAELTFPLALLGIGASLRRQTLARHALPAGCAAVIKNAGLPAVICAAAYACGVRDETLAILFVVSGAPTAVASFIMAQAMNSDGELAAAIVFLSTLVALPSLTLGIMALRLLGAV